MSTGFNSLEEFAAREPDVVREAGIYPTDVAFEPRVLRAARLTLEGGVGLVSVESFAQVSERFPTLAGRITQLDEQLQEVGMLFVPKNVRLRQDSVSDDIDVLRVHRDRFFDTVIAAEVPSLYLLDPHNPHAYTSIPDKDLWQNYVYADQVNPEHIFEWTASKAIGHTASAFHWRPEGEFPSRERLLMRGNLETTESLDTI